MKDFSGLYVYTEFLLFLLFTLFTLQKKKKKLNTPVVAAVAK